MSRGNLLIVIVLSVALAGMFFWTLSLQSRQQELLDARAGGVAEAGGVSEREFRELKEQVDRHEGAIDAARAADARYERALAEIRGAIAEFAGAAPATEAPEGAGTIAAAGAPAELKETIEEVLEERDAKERQERYERMARGMSRFLLNDIPATDEQHSQFVDVIVSYMTEREQIRDEYGEDQQQAREDAVRRLDEDRDLKLQRIFSAADLEKIRERMNRGRRAFEGRGGGRGRGGVPGGAPGGR